MNDAELIERAEMGISHADFRRIFPRVVDDAAHAEVDLHSRVEWQDGAVLEVNVSPELIRRIALLKLPYVNIRFAFQGFSESRRTEFMARFDRAFQKGGG